MSRADCAIDATRQTGSELDGGDRAHSILNRPAVADAYEQHPHPSHSVPGVLALLERELAIATGESRREHLEAFRGPVLCHACQGSRLRPEALCVRVGQKTIHEITRLSIGQASRFFAGLEFPKEQHPIAQPLLSEILRRLAFLENLGVEYLTLDRPADSLSGGELQRVRLAASIGSGLAGVCYILDEPSIGLHPRDNQRLIQALRQLQRRDNTVLVVEHDEAMMRRADLLVDIGPGAGVNGGRIMAVVGCRHGDQERAGGTQAGPERGGPQRERVVGIGIQLTGVHARARRDAFPCTLGPCIVESYAVGLNHLPSAQAGGSHPGRMVRW